MKFIFLKIFQIIYKSGIRRIIFLFDPESAHNGAVALGEFFGKFPATRKFTEFFFGYENEMLEQEILGIKFKNPIGLAAGYDKNAKMTKITGDLGFGFEEVGSVSNKPSSGNPRPRLWRIVKSRGLIVWNGLANDGAEIIRQRLKDLKFPVPLGVSIVKTNSPDVISLEEAVPDVIGGFRTLSDIGSYFTLNISCPNTEGEGLFYNSRNLEILLKELQKLKITKPIFIKMPPDLQSDSVDKIIAISRKYGIKGFVLSNIVKNREIMKNYDAEELEKIDPEKGSISGKPVEELSNSLIKYVHRKTRGEFIIMGCGGVFSADDAYKKIRLGASLIQLITGMIFEGPQLMSQINYGLVKLLKKDGFTHISQAIGVDSNK